MTLAQAYKKQFGKVSFPFTIYDSKGSMTYYENGNGYWFKTEYNSQDNMRYFEDNSGCWSKREYDSNGNVTYLENSNDSINVSKMKSSCNGKVVEIDGKKYKLKELK